MTELVLLILLKVVYLIAGLALCFMGKVLIEKKYETTFKGEGSLAKNSFKFTTSSPGLVFLVAGLIIIGVAIFQKSEINETHKEKQTEKGSSTDFELNRYQSLVETTSNIRFAGESELTQFVQTKLIQAKEASIAGNIDEAAVHLSIAVVTQPNILASILADDVYVAVLKHPQFNAIVQARFKLPLIAVNLPSTTLSVIAEEVISGLKQLTTRQKPGDKQSTEARIITKNIPNKSGIESENITFNRLAKLLDISPYILLEVLNSDKGQWILNAPKILGMLDDKINWKIQNE